MLGDRRIVVVRRAERWLKPKRAGKAVDGAAEEAAEDGEDAGGGVDLGALEAYLEAPVPSAVLVFVASSVDRSRRFTKRLLEQAAVTWCGGLQAARPGEAAQLERAVADQVRREIDQAGRSIEGAAVEMLVRRAGGDISKLRDDVERLLLYTGKEPRITRGDVDEVVADGGAMVDDWAVVNAIADGDAARALRAAAGRLERGDSPHQLVGQLRWWVSTRLAEGAPERVKPALDALLRTDLALKRSGGDERVLLERLVVELTGRPVSRQGGWHGRRG
jgi:DNA polymerase-3 subunit delta